MTRRQAFLIDLEKLFKKYDFPKHEVDMYVSLDGPDDMIWVDLPLTESGGYNEWASFILPSRPFDKGGD